MTRRSTPGDERGSAALEAAIGVPAFLLFVGLVLTGGRMAVAHQAVEAAAADAARAASIARTETDADRAAVESARSSVADQHLTCGAARVTVDVSGFRSRPGVPASASVTVTCQVPLADLAVPGLPGSRTVSASARSPIDTYRERR
ncbi:TadE/TadG family type IV pilus assembly protein [Phycicoccus avicenniae]|uniref:TadE/TadG family type IV pilus assembly protein n=1 Tax=Phycicoccus avicenniae TaxID=2828860 RepID=UPI003D26858F